VDRDFEQLQVEQIVRIRIEAFSIASTSVKAHPDGTGAPKKRTAGHRQSRGGWNTTIHMVAADARTAAVFTLSPGHDHDAPHGRALLEELGPMPEGLPLPMDRARIALRTKQNYRLRNGRNHYNGSRRRK
jgi:hypothetical protein